MNTINDFQKPVGNLRHEGRGRRVGPQPYLAVPGRDLRLQNYHSQSLPGLVWE